MELHHQHFNTEILIKLPDTFEPLKSISYSAVDSHLVKVAPLHIKQLLKVRGGWLYSNEYQIEDCEKICTQALLLK